MKKTCLALLAASALPAFAALDIASVDIEGIKLGMNREETVAIIKAFCNKTMIQSYEEQPETINNIELDTHLCNIYDLAAALLDSKVIYINAHQGIDLDDKNDKDFIKNWQLAVQEKAVQKYGKPALEADNAAAIIIGQESHPIQHLSCWGECKTKNSGPNRTALEAKGPALFIGLEIEGEKATITRILIDEAAISAAQKNAPKTEAEKAAAKVNL